MSLKRLSILLTLLFCGFIAKSQENSPYSRFGAGDLQPDYFVQGRALGGATAALFDGGIINYSNPASYAWLNRAVLDLGLYANFLTIDDSTNQTSSANGSLSHLSLGLPIVRNHMGLSFGMLPFSRIQYNVETEFINDSIIGTERNSYTGNGTINQLYVGTAYRWRGFSAGLNVSYLFGSLDDVKMVSFPDQDGAYSTRAERSIRAGDFNWNMGLGYQHDFGNDLRLNIGLSGNVKTSITVNSEEEWLNVIVTGDNSFAVKDSIEYIDQGSTEIKLPSGYRAGFSLHQGFRTVDKFQWRLNAEYRAAQWSEYESPRAQDLADNWRISVGGELTPPYGERDNKLIRPLVYRLGAYYGTSQLVIADQQINEFGMTFGLSIPLSARDRQHSASNLNLAFDLGRRGSLEQIRENYLRATIGFSLSDALWFIKRKID